MPTLLIGYFRVSSKTQEQNSSLDDQRQKLIAAGVKEENLHFDVKSGKSFLRPGLKDALAKLQPNSFLVITKMDRVSRKLRDFYHLQTELERRGARLHCLEDDVEPSTPGGKLSFAVLAAAAEFELEIRAARIKSGIDSNKGPLKKTS